MANTNFFLDLRGKSKDGKGPVLIRIYHNATSTTVSTGIRVASENWFEQKIVKIPGAEALNASLQKKKSDIDTAIAVLLIGGGFQNKSASDLKKAISNGQQKKNHGHLVSSLFEEYMETGGLKEGTKELYHYTLKKVTAFGGEKLKLESINLKWLRSFDQYLTKSQRTNGKAIYLRCLRAVCNYAKHLHISFEYPFENFSIKHEETRKRNISIELLRKFKTYPTTKKNEVFRDYFFLMFYLIGINTKDLLLAKKSQITDGRFEYIREKTGKHYSIKIEPEAEQLLKKYKGKGEYLLEAMDHCVHYRSFQHEINDGLKEIGEVVEEIIPDMDNLFAEPKVVKHIKPVIQNISTYYARHTWATLAHELGISSDVIAMALGHSPANKITFVYIQSDPKKVDEANRKVIDYLIG